ncbi:MAG: DedA family protein [Candidatus Aenigmarchaeota archaeon]|nr:DedA family protein [Candidatus Aenigmarchaeota archaeon]
MLNEIVNFLIAIIYQNLFLGIFLGVFLETIFPPIPSEIILPLSGYLISFYNLSFFGLILGILIATVGTTTGSLLYYLAALKFRRKFVEKYGKYFFIDKKKLRAADNWFKKHGRKAVFFGRMLPGIRELISLPAGFSKMKLKDYIIYTFFGSLIWCSFLTSLGYFLGENWKALQLEKFSHLIFFTIILAIITYLIFKKLVKKLQKI